jgi:hypothetical protein
MMVSKEERLTEKYRGKEEKLVQKEKRNEV